MFGWSRLFGRGLQEGWISGHPYEVVPGGLEGVQTALENLKAGKASTAKYISGLRIPLVLVEIPEVRSIDIVTLERLNDTERSI